MDFLDSSNKKVKSNNKSLSSTRHTNNHHLHTRQRKNSINNNHNTSVTPIETIDNPIGNSTSNNTLTSKNTLQQRLGKRASSRITKSSSSLQTSAPSSAVPLVVSSSSIISNNNKITKKQNSQVSGPEILNSQVELKEKEFKKETDCSQKQDHISKKLKTNHHSSLSESSSCDIPQKHNIITSNTTSRKSPRSKRISYNTSTKQAGTNHPISTVAYPTNTNNNSKNIFVSSSRRQSKPFITKKSSSSSAFTTTTTTNISTLKSKSKTQYLKRKTNMSLPKDKLTSEEIQSVSNKNKMSNHLDILETCLIKGKQEKEHSENKILVDNQEISNETITEILKTKTDNDSSDIQKEVSGLNIKKKISRKSKNYTKNSKNSSSSSKRISQSCFDDHGDIEEKEHDDDEHHEDYPEEYNDYWRSSNPNHQMRPFEDLQNMLSMHFMGGGPRSSQQSIHGRFAEILSQLKKKQYPMVQIVALQELAEVLSISTEEMFMIAGGPRSMGFHAEQFVEILLGFLKIDPELAAFGLQGYAGGAEMNSPETMLLSCRCIANMMEALPSSTAYIIQHGGIGLLVSKLKSVEYIDLAEQVMSVLEKISMQYPSNVLKEDGLLAVLQYIDFFNLHVQKSAVNIAANISKSLDRILPSKDSDSYSSKINELIASLKSVLAILEGLLTYSDNKVVEHSVRTVGNIYEWVSKKTDRMKDLVKDLMIKNLLQLIDPAARTTPTSNANFVKVTSLLSDLISAYPEYSITLMTTLSLNDVMVRLLTSNTFDDTVSPKEVNSRSFSLAIVNTVTTSPPDNLVRIFTIANSLLPAYPKDGLFAIVGSGQQEQKAESNKQSDVKYIKESNISVSLETKICISDQKIQHLVPMASLLLPIAIECFNASVNFPLRKSIVKFVIKTIWHVNAHHGHIYDPSHVAKLVCELLTFKGILFNQDQMENVDYVKLIATQGDPNALYFLMCGLLTIQIIIRKHDDEIYRHLLREGILNEIEDTDNLCQNFLKAAEKRKKGLLKMQVEQQSKLEKDNASAEDGDSRMDDVTNATSNKLSEKYMETSTEIVKSDANADSSNRRNNNNDNNTNTSSTSNQIETTQTLDALQTLLQNAEHLLIESADGDESQQGSLDPERRELQREQEVMSGMHRIFSQLANSLSTASRENFDSSSGNTLSGLNSSSSRIASERYVIFIDENKYFISDCIEWSAKACLSILRSAESSPMINGEKSSVLMKLTELDQAISNLITDFSLELATNVFKDLAEMFQGDEEPTAHEIIESGISKSLVAFLSSSRDKEDSIRERHQLVSRLFFNTEGNQENCAMKKLIIKLQSLLSRSDFCRVVTAFPSVGSSSAYPNFSSSLFGLSSFVHQDTSHQQQPMLQLTRQMRLRLVPEEPETVSTLYKDGVMVSIHAIANLKHLAEFIKSRIIFQTPSDSASNQNATTSNTTTKRTNQDGAIVDQLTELEDDEVRSVVEAYEFYEDDEDDHHHYSDEDDYDHMEEDELMNVSVLLLNGEEERRRSRSLSIQNIQATITADMRQTRSSTSRSCANVASGDFEIQLSVDGRLIPYECTIFAAAFEAMKTKTGHMNPNVWDGTLVIKYKKKDTSTLLTSTLSTLSDNTKIGTTFESKETEIFKGEKNKVVKTVLETIKLMHTISKDNVDFSRLVDPSLFVNNKITAKLNRQQDEPLIIASRILPEWCDFIVKHYPFLIPFETRRIYLQSTSFGYSRSIHRWQSQQSSSNETQSMIGRIQRQKIRVHRDKILPSMMKIMNNYGSSQAYLEIEFHDEVGSGLGPTLEFYALVCQKLLASCGVNAWSSTSTKFVPIWRDDENFQTGNKNGLVVAKSGLFPCVLDKRDKKLMRLIIGLFESIGTFVAKALLDGRPLDFPLHTLFVKYLVYGMVSDINFDENDKLLELQTLDKFLHQSLLKLRESKNRGDKIQDFCLTFTLPGRPQMSLKRGGKEIEVTNENLEDYIRLVLDKTLRSGIQEQVNAFRQGFSKVFPISDLQIFSVYENVNLLGGMMEEDWSENTILKHLKADHGFSQSSHVVTDLVKFMSSLTQDERRTFLQFVTGSPRLPFGGWSALQPTLTVVCKTVGSKEQSDDFLPSVMTCVNYLKVPNYSSYDVLKKKFNQAIQEGQGSFHLS